MSPDTRVRVGVIGTGMMGLEHIENLKATGQADIVAFCDPNETSRDWARLVLGDEGAAQAFHSHHELLSECDLDAVVLASPNMTHESILLDVIDAGVDCLVEKPLCTSVEGCQRVIEAAAGSSALLWVGLEYRYMPPIARAIEMVHRGAIGTPRMVAMREHRFPFLPKVENWNRFSKNTGGTLVEKCCHFFDLLGLLAGAAPVRVMASGGQDLNHLDEEYEGRVPDIWDNAMVIIDYANGVRGSLDLCMFAEGSWNQEELSVVGTEAKIEAFLPSGELRFGQRAGWRTGVTSEVIVDERISHEGMHHGSSYLEHLDFLDAVRSRRAPTVTLEDGLLAVAVGVAAQRSAREQRSVLMSEIIPTR